MVRHFKNIKSFLKLNCKISKKCLLCALEVKKKKMKYVSKLHCILPGAGPLNKSKIYNAFLVDPLGLPTVTANSNQIIFTNIDRTYPLFKILKNKSNFMFKHSLLHLACGSGRKDH